MSNIELYALTNILVLFHCINYIKNYLLNIIYKNYNFFIFFVSFLLFFLFSNFNLSGQTFSLDSNGVTVKCSGCSNGDTGTVGGVIYTAVDNTTIRLTADGDWDTIVTTLVTDMSGLFSGDVDFNENISSWHTVSVTTMEDMFRGASAFNQDLSKWDTSGVLNMQQTFYNAIAFTNNINDWDVSLVTDMDGMFRGATSFNQPLNSWTVSNVLSMSNMFRDASAFNQPLNSWDVSKVKYMQFLFKSTIYNQPLNNWDVNSVLNMQEMFMGGDFNQPINNWNVSNVTNMSKLFRGTDFNQPLNSWTVSKVTNFGQMFMDNDKFNQPLDNWNVSSATNISSMFRGCSEFDQPLNAWNTSPSSTAKITNMIGVFLNARKFNQPLDNWDVSKVTRMDDMFYNAFLFNGDIDNWNVSSVTSMHEMFKNARVFNRDITGWQITSLQNISGMFYDALEFNQPLNAWNTSPSSTASLTNINNTFRNADKFNQPLNNWDTSNVIYMSGTFRAAALFNQDLSSWDTSSVLQMQNTFMNNPVFNNSRSLGVSNTLQWDTSSVTRMDNICDGATAFNVNVTGWNVSNVTHMTRMFAGASFFNQDLSNWNTSSATTLQGMFGGATIFNNGLSSGVSSTIMNWNTSNITNIESTFSNAPAFNGNISGWDVSNVTKANNLFNNASKFNHPLGGWDVRSIDNMNNMFASATLFDQDLNCWCVVHDPDRSNFSNSSPIDSKPLFLPRWAEPCDPSISFALSTIDQDDGLITPTIVSSGGTFTASITGGLVHRNNQWGSGKADFLDIDPNTGVINPSNSLAGVYDITYSTGACKSFTTSITVRSVNNPAYQLNYSPNSICRSAGGTITPTIIPTNSHATVPRIFIDPGNLTSYPNIGNAPDDETIVNLTTNSGFTHWEDGVVADNSVYHPDYRIRNLTNGIVHNPGYSFELLPGAGEDNLILNLAGSNANRQSWPRNSSSISLWIKESDWSDDSMVWDFTTGADTTGKDYLISEGGVWKRWLKGSGAQGEYILGNNTLTNNQWHHIVATRDQNGGPGTGNFTGVIKLYVNGVLTSTVTGVASGTLDNVGDVLFGRNQSGVGNAINTDKMEGEFGPIRIFAHELTQSEVEYEYDMFALRYKGSFSATPGGLSINVTTGVIDISASVSGTYQVTASWIEPTSSKVHTSTSTVTIGDSDPSFSYPLNTYCQSNDSVITPTITEAGGVFSAPSGLTLNTGTGGITPSTSTPGTYTVTYTTAATCSRTSTVTITITAKDSPSLTYSSYTSCVDVDGSVSFGPTLSIAGGTFSVSPASGLAIDSSGVITPSASSVNLYNITYTTTGTCPGTVSITFEILPNDDPTFSYPTINFCQSSISEITPIISGTPGGVFSLSPAAGLSFDTTTGGIVPSLSSVGSYTIGYTTPGPCAQTSSLTIAITASDSPTLSYPSYSSCINVDPAVSYTPSLSIAGGSFSVSPPSGLAINSSTGVISPSISSVGSYTIEYITSGTCSGTVSVTFEILPADDPTFSFSKSSYCSNLPNSITPTITGDAGVFSAPGGLIINSTTGVISPSASTPGTYTVTYTTSGLCPATSSATITINLGESSLFNYPHNIYCKGTLGTVTPTVETLGGTFTFTPLGLNIDSSTGEINTSLSSVATYTIEYTISGTCSETSSFILVINDFKEDSSFSYPAKSYCVSDISTVTPTIKTLGGTFSVSPSGLNINLTTGIINPSLSSVGSYTIEYATAGDCQDTSSTTIEIKPEDNPSFSFGSNLFCTSETNVATPTITTPGGTFTFSPLGLNIDLLTGVISPGSSLTGTYSITYTTPITKNLSYSIPQQDNLIGHYPLDDNNEDVSGNGYHGTASLTSNPIGANNRFGTPFSALEFDGDDSIYFGNEMLDEFNGTSNDSFTISIWLRYDYDSESYNETDFMSLGRYGCSNSNRGVIFRAGESGISDFGACSRRGHITGDFSDDTWHHFVYRYKRNVGRTIFVDGISRTVENANRTNMHNIIRHGLTIGGGYQESGIGLDPNADGYVGFLDDLKIWNTPLTDDEILNLYSDEDAPPAIPSLGPITLGCVNSTTISVTISSLVTGTFDYGFPPEIKFCANDSDLTPSISGLASGTFYSLPDGLDINLTTGKIDFQNSTPGTYNIFYEVPSLCGGSTTSSTIILSVCSPFSTDDLNGPDTCDTDGDGVCCASETIYGSNCEGPCSYFFPDVRFNTISSEWNTLDCDGDGVVNGDELIDNTDPRNACSYKVESRSIPVINNGLDCDGDGVSGRNEVLNDKTNPLNSCSVDINNITLQVTSIEDCDGDGVINSKEASDNTDPFNGCSLILSSVSTSTSLAWQALDCDGDGVLNGNEINDGTDVYDRCDYNYYSITVFPERGFDCDGDGISNWQEVVNSKTNPKDPCDFDLEFIDSPFSDQWRSLDCDGDDYPNSIDKFPLNRLEWFDTDNDNIGNNQDLDDDNDGIEDIKEGLDDLDNDGIPNSQDNDSDGDGCFDASEAGYIDPDFDGIIGSGIPEIDSNGKVSSSIGYVEIADNDINGILDFLESGSLIFEIFKEPNNTTRIDEESEIEISILINSENAISYKWQVNKSLDTSSPNTSEWIEITDDNMYGGTKTDKLTISNPLFSMEGWSYRAIARSPSYLCQEEIISQSSKLIITNLIIPNAFSPDGDGINDTWTIRGGLNENYPNNKIYIFNRWGVSVFESKGYQNNWNGSNNSNSSGNSSSNLPVGTYFYVLDLNGDGSNVKKGNVYLTRMNNE
ncbi:BspA family leucine-rich repeat surface protein [Flavobacteriaceae bacterium]|nr:BspA family leucine-rich repeat surface protein [Flavobacteriaceae bacterium]